jgi:hypothetical protein
MRDLTSAKEFNNTLVGARHVYPESRRAVPVLAPTQVACTM